MNIIVATRGVDHATNHDQHPSLPSANIVSLKYSSKHSNSNFSKLWLSHHLGYCIGRNFQTIFKNTTKIFHLQSIRNIPLQVSALGKSCFKTNDLFWFRLVHGWQQTRLCRCRVSGRGRSWRGRILGKVESNLSDTPLYNTNPSFSHSTVWTILWLGV